MKIAICVDKSGGVLFGGRRLSQDSVLREKLLAISSNGKLLMNEYSGKQFEESEQIIITEDFLLSTDENNICFIENTEVPIDKVTELYLFNWNRDYPADTYFKFNLNDFKRIKKEDFVGSSHKKITLEIYRRI